jgi:hypothetical protein
MNEERALVVSASTQLLDRSGIEVERSVGVRAGRYVMGVSVGMALATILAIVAGARVGVLALLGVLFGPPLAFFAGRVVRFARAGFAAAAAFRMAKYPLSTRLAQTREGQWVRVRGQILPGPTFTSAGGKPRVVLACYVGTLASLRPSLGGDRRWELHGIDFNIAAVGGERVRVRVAGARFLGRPSVVPVEWFERRPLASRNTDRRGIEVASVYGEDVVAVGDEIEVLGFLRREIDPAAEAGFRGSPLTLVLGARQRWSLLIRRARET